MAWTISITEASDHTWKDGTVRVKITMEVTSDASASGDVTLSQQLETDLPARSIRDRLRGSSLDDIKYLPDGSDTPTSACQITVDDEDGVNFFDETVAVVGTKERFDGAIDSGKYVPCEDYIFAFTTLGNTKKAIFKIWILT